MVVELPAGIHLGEQFGRRRFPMRIHPEAQNVGCLEEGARFLVVDELDHLFAPVAFKPRRQSVRIGRISHQVLILGSGDQPFGVNVVAQWV